MGKVIWSNRARSERGEIFKYWNKRNGNNAYTQKLNTEIKNIIELVKENPLIGGEIDFFDGIRRMLVLRNYSIFYTIIENNIYIVSFWDNRQNPDGLEFK